MEATHVVFFHLEIVSDDGSNAYHGLWRITVKRGGC